jgi:beta-glucosidase
MSFRKDFVWGAAAASYQIEGAHDADGKGPSVWDEFCRWEGKTWKGQTGEVACDHYHRWAEDVALMKRVGLKGYRLSIAWPRILPDGVGTPNDKGLAFYDRLVDALLAAGIQPWVTLFHWDLPAALQRRGGWLNREIVEWFGRYTRAVVERLGDRVRHWMTLNEPQVFISHGYGAGVHAPGLKLCLEDQLLAVHHVLMAHGRAVQTIRQYAKAAPQVGWAPVGGVKYPATESPADVQAAREATMAVSSKDVWSNAWFGDPVVLGGYPESGLKAFGRLAPKVQSGDMELMKQPLDFYGMNNYGGAPVRAGEDGQAVEVPFPPGSPITAYYWGVTPLSHYWCPKFLYERYKLPIVVTENGMANADWVALDGAVHDPQRIDFMRRYLLELRRAAADGVDIRGYFHWSILDNFEWAEGFKQRFGLIHVDFETLQRTPKDSALWYAEVIRANGANL